jgi:hypothetical protein
MKQTILMMLFLGGWMGLQAQFLGGFFDQAATQLQLDGEQLAALRLYTTQLETGYRVVENGITDMGQAKGGEYSLHQGYFASLAAVNPAIAGMPQVQGILTWQSAITTGFSADMDRWQCSGGLTSTEVDELNEFNQTVSDHSVQVVQAVRELVTANQLTMTDDQRIAGIQRIWVETKQEYGDVQDIVGRTDLLVWQRLAEQGDAGILGQFYSMP